MTDPRPNSPEDVGYLPRRGGPARPISEVLPVSRPQSSPDATCRSCGAPIIWALMPSGKMNPIDRDPSDRGNIVLYRNPGTGKVRGEVLAPGEQRLPAGGHLRVSHFVTCPNSKKHRRRGS